MRKLAYVFLMGAALFNPASAFAEDRAVNINISRHRRGCGRRLRT